MKAKVYFSKTISFILTLMLVMNSMLAVAFAKEITTSPGEEGSDVIVVDVYKNTYDEEYIKDITLEDGTRVGDHEYMINYVPTVARASSLPSFYFAGYITRDGEVSLSLDPIYNVRYNESAKDSAWNNEILNPSYGIVNDSRWRNTQVMKWQYDCHFNHAKDKDTWNIEPHRNANSYAYVVLRGCNP